MWWPGRILGGVDVPDEVEHRQRDILRMQVIDGICYQARDMEMEWFRGDIMRVIACCQALLEEARQPQEPPGASSFVGGGGVNGRKGAMLIMESEKTIVGRPPAQPFSLYFIIIVCICRS